MKEQPGEETASHVKCPYCGHLTTDFDLAPCMVDGVGHECSGCGKLYQYDSYMVRYFTSKKADCLNGAAHNWQPMWMMIERYPDARQCQTCGHRDWKPTPSAEPKDDE